MHQTNNKWISIVLSLLVISTLAIPVVIFAQSGYEPLAPIPGFVDKNTQPIGTDFTAYFNGWVRLLIGVAGVLAVIVITIAGVEYIMAGDSESRISEAKDKIWKAIFGLLLAIGAYLILYTIDPRLLKTKLKLEAPTINLFYVKKETWTAENYSCTELTGTEDQHQGPFNTRGECCSWINSEFDIKTCSISIGGIDWCHRYNCHSLKE